MVDFKVYRLDSDPIAREKYQTIRSATVIINQEHVITRINAGSIQLAFEQAVKELL